MSNPLKPFWLLTVLPDNATGEQILWAIKDAEQNILRQIEKMDK